jgi:hypothetical protein
MIIGLKNKSHEKVLETKEGEEIKIRIACKVLFVEIVVGIRNAYKTSEEVSSTHNPSQSHHKQNLQAYRRQVFFFLVSVCMF